MVDGRLRGPRNVLQGVGFLAPAAQPRRRTYSCRCRCRVLISIERGPESYYSRALGGPGAGLRAVRAEVCWCGELGDGCLGVLEIALAPPDQRVSTHLTPRSKEAQKLRGMGLLHAAVPVLLAAVAEVEAGGVGGAAAKIVGFGSFPAFEAHMRAAVGKLPAVLEEELLEQASIALLSLTSPHNLATTTPPSPSPSTSYLASALATEPFLPILTPYTSTQAHCLTPAPEEPFQI